MGRGKFNKRNRGGRGGGQRRDNRYSSFPEITKENEMLQDYYNALFGLSDEAQQEQFWAALRKELPNSFRFCGSKGHALAVKKLLQTRYIPEITKITHLDGQPVDPPKPVPWYPDSLAWWMTTPKNVIRKFAPFAAFQRFLVSETSIGNISRQEVVSMIPPLLMDVRPGMVVLDMCAAPGSKAAQLLEMIHHGEEGRMRKVMQTFAKEDGLEVPPTFKDETDADMEIDMADDGRATGLLIANDANYQRSHMLIHQLKRLSSANMIVTNHDATLFPSIRLPSDDPKTNKYLKFDRILADVPCSGDGTLRKNVNLWNDWQPGNALGLHLTQVRILVRALQILKPGGRAVYSTCSMNPVENESVVYSAIERCGGSDKIEILDCSDQLPGLRRESGLRKWKVMDKSGRIWNDWSEVEEFTKTKEDGLRPGRLVPGMFPRTGDEDSDLPIERCMRVHAHLQDTGGFFITVLHKKAEFKAKPEEARKPVKTGSNSGAITSSKVVSSSNGDTHSDAEVGLKEETTTKGNMEVEEGSVKRPLEEGEDETATSTKRLKMEEDIEGFQVKVEDKSGRKKKLDGPYEEPFKYLSADHPAIENIREFYHLSPRFPTDRYMVRNALGEPAKAIYYTTALARDILVCNEGKGVKFIHSGVKMFVKQDAPSADVCRWRIQSDGMPILQAYVGSERIVHLHKKETLRKLLIEMFPKIADDGWKELNEIGERVKDIPMGCSVLRVTPELGEEDIEPIALPLWKSFHSLNLMLPKEDRSAMLLRIFNDTTPLINMGLQKNKDKQQPEEDKEEDKLAVEPGQDTSMKEEPGSHNNELYVKAKDSGAESSGVNLSDIEGAPSE